MHRRHVTAGIDLHLHSTASDGEYPPREIVRRAHTAGLSVVALTDHDSIDGVAEAQTEAARIGLRVIAGCEFSARADWGEVHLLGYFLPLADAELDANLAEWRAGRWRRGREIVRRLRQGGVDITFEDVENEADGAAIGRPHVARVLVACGAVRSLDDAFGRWLGWRKPAFVAKELPAVAVVTDLVRRVGGVTVLAHPGRHTTKNRVQVLCTQGVRGLEVKHPTHDDVTEARIERFADRYGMVRTGGTDWHGDTVLRNERSALGAIRIPSDWLLALEDARE